MGYAVGAAIRIGGYSRAHKPSTYTRPGASSCPGVTMSAPVVITDHPTPDEIRTALSHLCHRAKREMPAVGVPGTQTPWDCRHEAINELLGML